MYLSETFVSFRSTFNLMSISVLSVYNTEAGTLEASGVSECSITPIFGYFVDVNYIKMIPPSFFPFFLSYSDLLLDLMSKSDQAWQRIGEIWFHFCVFFCSTSYKYRALSALIRPLSRCLQANMKLSIHKNYLQSFFYHF